MDIVTTYVMLRSIFLSEEGAVVKQIAIEWTVKLLAYTVVAGMLAAILIQRAGND